MPKRKLNLDKIDPKNIQYNPENPRGETEEEIRRWGYYEIAEDPVQGDHQGSGERPG